MLFWIEIFHLDAGLVMQPVADFPVATRARVRGCGGPAAPGLALLAAELPLLDLTQ